MNFIVAIHIKSEKIGGSIISATDLCNSLVLGNGHNVILISNKNNIIVKHNLSDKVIKSGYDYRGGVWYCSLYNTISKCLKNSKKKIDAIICFDRQSAYVASILSKRFKIPIVPIIAGGSKETIKIEPLNIPTIVFSEENKDDLVNKYGWSPEIIYVIPSRIDTKRFGYKKREFECDMKVCNKKLAYISRISEDKKDSFESFINELNGVKSNNRISVDIIGDGEQKDIWENLTKIKFPNNKIKINFIGPKKITSSMLHKYDLIIGQGRVVLESISIGVPVAVNGSEGYKGIVKDDNFDIYSKTNFTGRSVNKISSLKTDLKNLKSIENYNLIKLRKRVEDNYDIRLLKNCIISKNWEIADTKLVLKTFKNIIISKLRLA